MHQCKCGRRYSTRELLIHHLHIFNPGYHAEKNQTDGLSLCQCSRCRKGTISERPDPATIQQAQADERMAQEGAAAFDRDEAQRRRS